MEDWLDEYIIQINSDQKPAVDPVETALISIRSELEQLQHQQENICEYLEKGIYTIDVFSKRNATLNERAESSATEKRWKSTGKNRISLDSGNTTYSG